MSEARIPAQPSCADDFDPQSLPVAEALARIQQQVQPVSGCEQLNLRAALGRVLAADVLAPVDVPAYDNSAMDGYAVRSADLPAVGSVRLRLVGSAFAGQPWGGCLGAGEAVRIMTGALLPDGADSVVMQEHAARDGDSVSIGSGHRAGQNVRRVGEDLRCGSVVLAGGRRIAPFDVGVLASLGRGEVRVRRRVRVAFFSTGDELRSIGEPLEAGCVYDSNRYSLYGMLSRLGVDVLDFGVVRDCREALRETLREAAASADVVITSGGVSVGEADFVRDTLLALGRIHFWKIAMKPGRPLAFGHIDDALFFGLPGNPVAVVVTFFQFVQPALHRLMGMPEQAPLLLRARALAPMKKRPGRTEYQRGILQREADGQLGVRLSGAQGSGVLSSMSRANCFVVLAQASAEVAAGDWVDVQPFEGLY
ncbi:gephyrin-like molybdotransferase Glp [Plasticicumulans acidivorans]|uniref:Molybdopterin molybdenumtransferase n=1 Tax=Plasticicumulans acidivorans TaxID=886464 RepID=A0A317MTH4_9GAMM|nr:gephyrin-like molybdotransferase Glp [Plasticicumulans acidivorans]PWV60598.1 molybdopterin molybdochelatase [Plasticicumulans acidivorans]